MNIGKAIEILDIYSQTRSMRNLDDYMDAIQLAIEALKAIRDFRKDWSGNRFHFLPAETRTPSYHRPTTSFGTTKP